MPRFSRFLRSIALPVLAVAATGCASVPALGPAPAVRQADNVAAERSLAGNDAATWPSEDWWRRSPDPQLIALIEEGQRNSPDLAIALARYRRAAGAAQEAGAARLPSADLQGDLSFDKQSYNNGFPREFLPQGWQDSAQIAGALNFDLDLWGRNRAALAAATSEERAALVEARQARLMLATGIAAAYADLGRLFAERDVRQQELDVRAAQRRLVAERQANGLETRGSLRQSDSELARARVALNAAEEAIALRRHQLAALIGAGPDRGLALTPPVAGRLIVQGVPENVTTDLLGRRPDIVAARARVEAAASRIKVARADFFPAVRLSALVGLQSLGVNNLVDSGSTFGSVGPAFSLPIFHGGALRGRYRASRADYDGAVADYDRIVLDAYREAADAVTSARRIEERLGDARLALGAAEDAFTVARLRYEGGLSNYLDVLTVQDRLLDARLAVAGLEAARLDADVRLIRALGGGFTGAGQTGADTDIRENTHG